MLRNCGFWCHFIAKVLDSSRTFTKTGSVQNIGKTVLVKGHCLAEGTLRAIMEHAPGDAATEVRAAAVRKRQAPPCWSFACEKTIIYQDRLGTNAKQLDFEQTRFVHFLLSGGEMEGAVKVGLWLSSSLPFGCGTRRMVSDILLKSGCAQLDF